MRTLSLTNLVHVLKKLQVMESQSCWLWVAQTKCFMWEVLAFLLP